MALTTTNKIHVCRVAREAYDAWPGREEYERTTGAGKNAFTEWRHDQQEVVIGVRSLRHAHADDYSQLLSHFHKLRLRHLREGATRQFAFSP